MALHRGNAASFHTPWSHVNCCCNHSVVCVLCSLVFLPAALCYGGLKIIVIMMRANTQIRQMLLHVCIMSFLKMLKHFSIACKSCVISIATKLSVCLSVCSHISKTTCPNLTKLTVPVAHVRGSDMTMTAMQLETYFRLWTTFPSKPLSQKNIKTLAHNFRKC